MRTAIVLRLATILFTATQTAWTATTWTVIAIPGPSVDIASVSVAGINDAGQVAGTASGNSGTANFLYTPGVGVTNIERTGPPSPSTFEGSRVIAINGSGQILLLSGLLYTPGSANPLNLTPAVTAAFPTEPTLAFIGLNDGGEVSGTAQFSSEIMGRMTFSQDIFRYSPTTSPAVVSATHSTDQREFPRGPFLIDDAGDIVFSRGFPPAGAIIAPAAGVPRETGCGVSNGWATAINNSGQIGGGWGEHTPTPTICTFPTALPGMTTVLAGENAGFINGLNNLGDAVGYIGDLNGSPSAPMLFTHGQVIDVNTLFPAGSGWVATSANAINDAGQIAGTGTLNRIPQAFVLSPAAPTNYTLQTVCTSPCEGVSLTNSGSVVADDHNPNQPGFMVNSPRHGVTAIPNASAIMQMNDTETIAGVDLTGHAFISDPPYVDFENLNPVFGWTNGVAQGINDGRDVIGFGSPSSFGPLSIGLNIVSLFQIDNARQITGSYLDAGNNLKYFLYTPGSGVANLPDRPLALSNTGHILAFSQSSGYYIQTANGTVPLPPGYTWRSLNDRDEVVGDAVGGDPALQVNAASYYSVATGAIRLSTLLATPGYFLQSALFINNGGQILVDIETTDLSTTAAALLIPGGGSPVQPANSPQPNSEWMHSERLHPFPVRSVNGVATNSFAGTR
jgi:hypothetical protein